ncbi:MAG TPA: ferritin-like domain-containing protein [Cellvibrionaceae bacterium]
MNTQQPFTDTQTLRTNARQHIEEGAVTAGYTADRAEILVQLNAALATELLCMLRYRYHHFAASGIQAKAIADEFLIHSNQELAHADALAARIIQLGGEPNFAPDDITRRSHAEFLLSGSLVGMIKEDLVAERIAIDSYREFIQYLGDKDPTTSHVLKGILAVEEEHADELADFLKNLPRQEGEI